MSDNGSELRGRFEEGAAHLRRGALDHAQATFESILAEMPDHPGSLHFIGVIRFQRGEREAGIDLMRRSLALRPDEPGFNQNLGGALRALGRYDEALPVLERAVALAPEDALAAANLATTLHRLGRGDEAARAGQRALELKDAQAVTSVPDVAIASSSVTVAPFRTDDPARNVIAFSLWGEKTEYLAGALENATLAKTVYPHWTARFYVDATVPGPVTNALEKAGAEVVVMPRPERAARGLFWRFEAANDPAIDRFLCRDCDARLNAREAAAVAAWIESGTAFHVMRDSLAHLELILAGMWGGIAGVLPDMAVMADAKIDDYGGRWADQIFLRREIWPRIRNIALTHDSHYRIGDSRPFPPGSELPAGQHVGGAVLGERARPES